MTRSVLRLIVYLAIACGVMTPVVVRAHHSGFEYAQTTVEIEGTLVAAAWENPHVHFFVRAKDNKGATVTWDIEANSLSSLRCTDATPENLKIGDAVKVAGSPSRSAPKRIWAKNILTANGKEITFGPGVKPRWTSTASGSRSTCGDALARSSDGIAQVAEPPRPQTVEILSGGLHLKGFLWRPAGHGPFPAVVFNHGRSDAAQQYSLELGLTLEQLAQVLGPVFVRHGFVFLYPFRRGEGPSADQGQFIGDLLQREEAAKGVEAQRRLQAVLMTTDHLQDALAALSFLKSLAYVDARRVAVAGHSFGGQLTLLEASRDRTVRAAVTFGAAAASWDRSPELRVRLLEALRGLGMPVMLIQAANDYSLSPSLAMDRELTRLSKLHARKIYPASGNTPSHGHNFLYFDVARWEHDVFAFLEANVRANN